MLSKLIKRSVTSLHRILGTILSILFLVWFLSGFVMIFHGFPRVKPSDKYGYTQALPSRLPAIDSVLSILPDSVTATKLNLKSYPGQAYFSLSAQDSIIKIALGTDKEIHPFSFSDIEQYAKQWNSSQIDRVDTLYKVDQWIPFGYLKKDMPIYKFYFADTEKHQLYISSQSGEALQYTDNNSRFWAWVGAIPHWIYFTSLRQDSAAWISTVIWLSGIGSIMCLLGLVYGIYILVKQYRKKKSLSVPYKKFVYRWHYLTGFIFGIFVFTFVFSGMMSLADVPQWMVKVHNETLSMQSYMPYSKTKPQDYPLDYRSIVESYPNQVKSIEWSGFGDIPTYKAVIGDSLSVFDASSSELKSLMLTEGQIIDRIKQIHTEGISIVQLTEYDNYYIDRKRKLPLPVYKVEVNDADKSVYYVNPKTGDTRYFNNNSRAGKWMYQGLHSFNFKFLADRPWLWNIVMWVTMLGGTSVAVTGVWLSIKYLRRKIKRFSKKCRKQ